MRLRTKLIVAAVPLAAVTVVGTIVAIKRHRRRKRGRRIPDFAREAIEDMLKVRSEDFISSELGNSLFQKKLEKLTDRQLIVLLALVELGVVVRRRGIDPNRPTAVELDATRHEFERLLNMSPDRKSLLARLGSFGFEVFSNSLRAATTVLSRA